MNFNWINTIQQASWVTRYHTAPTIVDQSVGHHSFMVAMMCHWLTDGKCSKNLLVAALSHDLPEINTGDIPAPAKMFHGEDHKAAIRHYEEMFLRAHGLLVELTDEEDTVLRWADTLELIAHCIKESLMGNRYARSIALKGISYAETYPHHVKAVGLLNHLKEEIGK